MAGSPPFYGKKSIIQIHITFLFFFKHLGNKGMSCRLIDVGL